MIKEIKLKEGLDSATILLDFRTVSKGFLIWKRMEGIEKERHCFIKTARGLSLKMHQTITIVNKYGYKIHKKNIKIYLRFHFSTLIAFSFIIECSNLANISAQRSLMPKEKYLRVFLKTSIENLDNRLVKHDVTAKSGVGRQFSSVHVSTLGTR